MKTRKKELWMVGDLEAAIGIEPMNKAFADRSSVLCTK